MAFSDYSTTPASNTNLGGINVAEGCAAGNLNDAIRRLAADGKLLSDQVAGFTSGMPVSGGAFTGDISRSSRGAYLHHQSASLTDGQVVVLPQGSGDPAGAEGRIALFSS